MSFTLSKLEHEKYKEVIKSPIVEVCGFTKNSLNGYLLKGISEFFQTMVPDLIHDCPYEGV